MILPVLHREVITCLVPTLIAGGHLQWLKVPAENKELAGDGGEPGHGDGISQPD